MEYIGNVDYWNSKFKSRGKNLLEPDRELVSHINLLSRGSVLDLACGDGRNSLYLLQNGFKLTGVDFSTEALDRLKHFAKQNSFDISTLQADLNQKNALDLLGCFDNIIINHYKLADHQLKSISKRLNIGGVLFLTGFGHKHKIDEKITVNDLIVERDLKYLNKELKLIHYNEYEDERGFFVTYVYKKG